MVHELFRWDETTALPLYRPGEAAPDVKGDIPTRVSGSVLCHVSASKGGYATHLRAANEKERSERYVRLTVDGVTKAMETFNALREASAIPAGWP